MLGQGPGGATAPLAPPLSTALQRVQRKQFWTVPDGSLHTKGGTDSVPGPARVVPLSGTLGRAGPLFTDYIAILKLSKTLIFMIGFYIHTDGKQLHNLKDKLN